MIVINFELLVALPASALEHLDSNTSDVFGIATNIQKSKYDFRNLVL